MATIPCVKKKAIKELEFLINVQEKILPIVIAEKLTSVPKIIQKTIVKVASKDVNQLKHLVEVLNRLPSCK